MSFLEKDITRKKRIDENATRLDASNNDSGIYKVEAIWDNTVYTRKSELSHLPGFHYLVLEKEYLKEENT